MNGRISGQTVGWPNGAGGLLGYYGAVAVGLGALLGVLQPDSTAELGKLESILVWQARSAVVVALAVAALFLFQSSTGFSKLGPWLRILISGLAAALIFLPLDSAADLWLGLEGGEPDGESQDPSWQETLGAEAITVLVAVPLAWAVINAPWILRTSWQGMERVRACAPAGTTPPVAEPDLPKGLDAEVIALEADLNYLKVHRASGSGIILHALERAIEDLGRAGIAGIRTHRSYWVAIAAIDEMKNDRVRLKNGLEIPVSRRKKTLVKAEIEKAGLT
jgi:hypothetical protein